MAKSFLFVEILKNSKVWISPTFTQRKQLGGGVSMLPILNEEKAQGVWSTPNCIEEEKTIRLEAPHVCM